MGADEVVISYRTSHSLTVDSSTPMRHELMMRSWYRIVPLAHCRQLTLDSTHSKDLEEKMSSLEFYVVCAVDEVVVSSYFSLFSDEGLTNQHVINKSQLGGFTKNGFRRISSDNRYTNKII